MTCKFLLHKLTSSLNKGYIYKNLAIDLLHKSNRQEVNLGIIIDKIKYIEKDSEIDEKMRFKHPPLNDFFKFHYSEPKHLIKNIGNKTGLGYKTPSKKFSESIKEFFKENDGELVTDKICADLTKLIFDQVEENHTGEWIIFYRKNSENYYLTLSNHSDIKQQKILELLVKLLKTLKIIIDKGDQKLLKKLFLKSNQKSN